MFNITSYKKIWEGRYSANSTDWDVILNSPVLDAEGRWAYGGPTRIETELDGALKLAMGGAPDDLVDKAIQRALVVVDAIDSLDLLNVDPRHRDNEFSHVKYIRGRGVIDLLQGKDVSSARWAELGRLEVGIAGGLKGDRDAVCEHRLIAALYFLLADDYLAALETLNFIGTSSVRAEELSALHGLVKFLVDGEGRDSAFLGVLNYFEKARAPTALSLEFRRDRLGVFCWALLVGKFVGRGDGELDADRAIFAMSM